MPDLTPLRNDLWNLFPVDSRANRAKGDKLPTRRLVIARRKAIQETWEQEQNVFPTRFGAEVSSFAGTNLTSRQDWPERFFSLFAEAVEITAIQRGAERWEP